MTDSSPQHGRRKSEGERAKLIAQAFMKERALIYSKSFTSPLRMWSDERSGVREKGKGEYGRGDRDRTYGV